MGRGFHENDDADEKEEEEGDHNSLVHTNNILMMKITRT
jgi:hypothetical protein